MASPAGFSGGLLPSSRRSEKKFLVMKNKDKKEIALKISKEIVIKFIEVGRVSVSSFEETWNLLFKSVLSSL